VSTLSAVLALVAGAIPIGAQDFASVQIRATKLNGSVYLLTGRGGNMAVSAGEQGVFLVDDQFAPLTPKIEAALRKIRNEPVRFVLNTHWHPDHTGGNENLGAAGALIVSHGNVRQRLSQKQPEPPESLPIITFTSEVTFHLNGEEVHVFHVPNAHTDGDAIVHFKGSNVIHAGDIFFNGIYPFIDVDNGGGIDGMIAAQDQILGLARPDSQIVPGHGPLSDADGLRAARDMLANVRDRVRAAHAAGDSVDAFIASKPLADLDDEWGDGFMETERFLRIVWRDLDRPKAP
jgi:glyoxylase-like metal-dependent hydrolase (beta-lactamase superfamily II)